MKDRAWIHEEWCDSLDDNDECNCGADDAYAERRTPHPPSERSGETE
jgi:hypothetical protein